MKQKKKQFRHGDLLIERIDSIPKNIKTNAIKGRPILAHGEVTGHCHEIEHPEAVAKFVASETGRDGDNRGVSIKFATLKSATRVVHQEHAPITLDPGDYRISQQREYSPEAIRQVAD